MTMPMLGRRAALALGAGLSLPGLAQAQDFPNRPMRMIVPYPPGGASDVIARLLAPQMGELLGQPVVVENRPGGNGRIACELVARAPADGYTLLMGNAGPNALNAALYGASLSYNVITDFTPISLVSQVPMIIAANPEFTPKGLRAVIAEAKRRNGDLSYGHGGTGAAPHLTMEQLAGMENFRWTAVPFRGGQLALTATLANQIPLVADTAPVIVPHVREGRLTGVAVTTAQRIPQLPDLPTIAEQGFPGFEAVSWGGVLSAPGLPAPILRRLHDAVVRGMGMPSVKEALDRQGVQIRTSSPDEFLAYIKAEVARWTEVVQKGGIKPE
jgi:tripartite-type tricarboxylate transporter receptor subunit TctC